MSEPAAVWCEAECMSRAIDDRTLSNGAAERPGYTPARMAPARAEEAIERLRGNILKVFIGNAGAVDRMICCLLARGHVLIEDVPGVGKTVLATTLARSMHGTFNRIQMTPDLLPGDVLGVDPPTPSGIHVGEPHHPRAGRTPDRVVHRVAGNRRADQQAREQPHVERPGGGYGARREQQRIARQHRRHHEARLGEDDREEHPVDPPTICRDEIEQIPVDVQEQIDEVGHLNLVQRLAQVVAEVVDVFDLIDVD